MDVDVGRAELLASFLACSRRRQLMPKLHQYPSNGKLCFRKHLDLSRLEQDEYFGFVFERDFVCVLYTTTTFFQTEAILPRAFAAVPQLVLLVPAFSAGCIFHAAEPTLYSQRRHTRSKQTNSNTASSRL